MSHEYCGDDVGVLTNDCVHACAPDTDDGDDDCLHISSTEQAGGWLMCDDCGSDVTRSEFKRRMVLAAAKEGE